MSRKPKRSSAEASFPTCSRAKKTVWRRPSVFTWKPPSSSRLPAAVYHLLLVEDEAIEALKSAASLYEAIGDMGDAADAFSSAGDLLSSDNTAEACNLYKSAAQLFIKSGKSADVSLHLT